MNKFSKQVEAAKAYRRSLLRSYRGLVVKELQWPIESAEAYAELTNAQKRQHRWLLRHLYTG